MKYLVALCVLVVILIVWSRRESYMTCGECTQPLRSDRQLLLNPFVYPYSGTKCVGDVYSANAATVSPDAAGPMYNATTPDHQPMTN